MARSAIGRAIGMAVAALAAQAALAQTGDGATIAAPVAESREVQDRAFAADFDRFLENTMARFPSVPALSVAVVRDGAPVFVGAKGRADVEGGIAASADTPFYIASSTKAFVGTALARLDARGTIDLDWTMRELAPD